MRELPCKYVCPAWMRVRATQWIDRLGSSMTWVVQFEGCPFFAEVGAAACRICARGRRKERRRGRIPKDKQSKSDSFSSCIPFQKEREGSSLLSPLRPQPPMPHRPLFHVFKGNKNKRPRWRVGERAWERNCKEACKT